MAGFGFWFKIIRMIAAPPVVWLLAFAILEQNARFLNRALVSQSFVFTASFSPETVSHFSQDALERRFFNLFHIHKI